MMRRAATTGAEEARMTNVLSFPHQVTRLVFDAGQPYEKFRGRYEAAVPPANPPRPDGFSWRHAPGAGPGRGRGRARPARLRAVLAR